MVASVSNAIGKGALGRDYVVKLVEAEEKAWLIASARLPIAATAPRATRTTKRAYSVRSWPCSSSQSRDKRVFVVIGFPSLTITDNRMKVLSCLACIQYCQPVQGSVPGFARANDRSRTLAQAKGPKNPAPKNRGTGHPST